MTITPEITEVHERRYAFSLTPEQVQDAIITACLKAAGLSDLPDGVEFTIRTGGGFQPIDLRFTVPVVAATSSAPIKAPAAPAAPPPAASAPISAPEAPEKPKAAPAPRTAPVRKPQKGRPLAWDKLSMAERGIVLHLESLPDTFSPHDDRSLVQCILGRIPAATIADELAVTAEDVVTRWRSMWCNAVLNGQKTPTAEGQERLMAALRYRVETEE